MKTLSAFRAKFIKRVPLFASLVFSLCYLSTSAQTPLTSFVPSSFSDNTLTGAVTDIRSLNCDMLDIGAYFSNTIGNDKLWSIAYGPEKGTGSAPYTSGLYVGVENGTSSYTPLAIPLPYSGLPGSPTEAFDPDVVVGNWSDGSGTHYFVAAVYQDINDDIYMDAYELDFSSYPYITISGIIVANKLLGSGWHPHIDLGADPTGYKSGTYTPKMHRFSVAWSGNFEVWVLTDDMATFTSSTPVSPDHVIPNHGLWSDIACVTDPVNGHERAYIIYNDGTTSQTNYITEWDLNMKSYGPTYTGTIANFNFFHPRIDAATLYDYNDMDAGTLFHAVDFTRTNKPFAGTSVDIWHATYGEYVSVCGGSMFSTYYDEYNPTYAIAVCTLCNPIVWWENITPAVCGTGDFLGGGVGPSNDNFTYGFYSSGNHSTSSSSIDNSAYFVAKANNHYCHGSGMIGPIPGSQLYTLNNSSLPTTFNANTLGSAIGVATCTNSGYDIMGAWYTGDPLSTYAGEIRYKFGTSSYSFKLPASTANTSITEEAFTVYPNPVQGNHINLKGHTSPGATAVIEDMLGRKVLTLELQGQKQIDVSALNNGIYILTVEHEDKSTHTKRFSINR